MKVSLYIFFGRRHLCLQHFKQQERIVKVTIWLVIFGLFFVFFLWTTTHIHNQLLLQNWLYLFKSIQKGVGFFFRKEIKIRSTSTKSNYQDFCRLPHMPEQHGTYFIHFQWAFRDSFWGETELKNNQSGRHQPECNYTTHSMCVPVLVHHKNHLLLQVAVYWIRRVIMLLSEKCLRLAGKAPLIFIAFKISPALSTVAAICSLFL